MNAPVSSNHSHRGPREGGWEMWAIIDNKSMVGEARLETLRNHREGLTFGLARGCGYPGAKAAIADWPD
jgi:hypothetical protein